MGVNIEMWELLVIVIRKQSARVIQGKYRRIRVINVDFAEA